MSASAQEALVGVINAGSSSVKFSFYEGESRILTGQVDGIGARPSARATGPQGKRSRPRSRGEAAGGAE
jgi:acetate kinase